MVLSKFRMETLASVLASIKERDLLFFIDIKDECFQIPVHPELRRYLQLMLDKKIHQSKTLCFGLLTGPQVFTKVFALVSTSACQ